MGPLTPSSSLSPLPTTLHSLNPLNAAWRRILAARKTVADHNTVGDGTILGGLLLVKAGDGGVAYVHAGKGVVSVYLLWGAAWGLRVALCDCFNSAQRCVLRPTPPTPS